MHATTIDDVIHQLTAIVERSRETTSRQGYFAALYRRVTIAVKEGIAAGRFQDGPRMERLDVIFANRCLEAYAQYQEGRACSQSWRVAFHQSSRWRPIILQHLLLGMNAHINLDLGIAAAQTVPGSALPGLERDFKEINMVLAEMTDSVKAGLNRVSPLLGWADRVGNRADDAIVNFSMKNARDAAWAFARKLAPLDEGAQAAAIAARDQEVARFARLISNPGLFGDSITFAIRLRESGDASKVIAALTA